ncbi:MAG: OmpH family outer membrane protein [Pyramidobacter sp.]|jgi:outer membrane protein
MKKYFHVIPLLAAVFFALAGAACAAEKIGVANMQQVLINHPSFEQVSKRIEAMYRAKEQELKTSLDKVTDKKQGAQIIQKKRQEAAQEETKLKDTIYKEIRAAVRTVAKNKGITVVLDSVAVMFGGEDITQDIIKELKKKK